MTEDSKFFKVLKKNLDNSFTFEILDKTKLKLLLDINSTSESLFIINGERSLVIFPLKNIINIVGISFNNENKRKMRKILEVKLSNKKYFDNTGNEIGMLDIVNVLDIWLKKYVA